MLKSKSRKRHIRSTRKKCINCTNWKERRPCRRSTRRKRNTKRKRMRGGRTDEPTEDTVDGTPVIEGAGVTIDGMQGTLDLKAFKNHLEYRDQQGKGGTPGYDD